MDYSRVEANPPHPNIRVEAVAHEAVVNYREWATTKALWWDQLTRRVKDAANKILNDFRE